MKSAGLCHDRKVLFPIAKAVRAWLQLHCKYHASLIPPTAPRPAKESSMKARHLTVISIVAGMLVMAAPPAESQEKKLYLGPLNIEPPQILTDKTVKYDYDIVYVRA